MYLYNIIYVDSIIYKYMLCDLATIRLWNIDFMARKGQNMQVLIYAKGSILPNHNPWESHVINPHKFGLLDWINSSVQNEGYFSSGYLCNIMIYKVYVLECGHYIHIHNIYIYSIGDIYIYSILQYKTSSKQFHSTKSTGSIGASSTSAPDLAPPLTDDAEEPPVAILKLQLPHVADIQEWYVWVKLRLSPTRMDIIVPGKFLEDSTSVLKSSL